MKAVSVIEDEVVIKTILKRLGLCVVKARPPPKVKKPARAGEPFLDYSDPQLPTSEDHLFSDVEYPVDSREAESSEF